MPLCVRPNRTNDTAAAAEAPLQKRLAAPPAGEADEPPLPPPQTQPLEKKLNREMNQIKPS